MIQFFSNIKPVCNILSYAIFYSFPLVDTSLLTGLKPVKKDKSCRSENWISIEKKPRFHFIGNRMCEYAHLKILEIEYNIKVSYQQIFVLKIFNQRFFELFQWFQLSDL